jgi:hypothetical protein
MITCLFHGAAVSLVANIFKNMLLPEPIRPMTQPLTEVAACVW